MLFREVLRDIKSIHYLEHENKIQLKVERKSNELIIKELPEPFSEQQLRELLADYQPEIETVQQDHLVKGVRYVTLATAKDAREAAKELFDKEIEGKKIKTSIRQQTLINIYNSILKMHNKKNEEMQKRRQNKEAAGNAEKEASAERGGQKDREGGAEKNGEIDAPRVTIM